MDIDPNTERLVSTVFIVINATSLILFHTNLGSRPSILIAFIITITAIFLLLSHETDFQSVRLGCSIVPLAVSVCMPKRNKAIQKIYETLLMAAPVITA
jgi:hypothetical protein